MSTRVAATRTSVRARRTELGLDQGALARLAGVSRQWIVEMEQGKTRAEIGLLLRTLHALRLDITLKPAKAPEPAREVFAPGLVDLDALIRRAGAGAVTSRTLVVLLSGRPMGAYSSIATVSPTAMRPGSTVEP